MPKFFTFEFWKEEKHFWQILLHRFFENWWNYCKEWNKGKKYLWIIFAFSIGRIDRILSKFFDTIQSKVHKIKISTRIDINMKKNRKFVKFFALLYCQCWKNFRQMVSIKFYVETFVKNYWIIAKNWRKV